MDKNGKVGYAVLGLGIGKAHFNAAASNPNCELLAVCDLREDRLAYAREQKPDIITYTDFEDLIKDPKIDVISLCLPSGMHAEYACKIMEAGKHVLVEKPVDITARAAERIIETAKRTGMKCGVIHQNRFNMNMAPVRDAIRSGKLGKIFLGTFEVKWYREQSYYDNDGGWRGTWAMDGGGSLMNQAVHTVDLMQWLMGKPVSVTSKAGIYGHEIETEDMTASLVTFENGAVATFVSTTCAYPGVCTGIKIYGTEGSVECDADALKLWKFRDGNEVEEAKMLRKYGRGNGPLVANDPTLATGHAYQVNDIIDAIRFDRDPIITAEDAIVSIKIIEAMYESAKTGKTVTLD